jgi:hypothetical protein
MPHSRGKSGRPSRRRAEMVVNPGTHVGVPPDSNDGSIPGSRVGRQADGSPLAQAGRNPCRPHPIGTMSNQPGEPR